MKPRRTKSGGLWSGGGRLLTAGILLGLLLACGKDATDPVAPVVPDQWTGLTTVESILQAPENFYGSTVILEGVITKKLTEDPTFEFSDGTGVIPVQFGLLPIPEMNKEFHLTGTAERCYSHIGVSVKEWEYVLES